MAIIISTAFAVACGAGAPPQLPAVAPTPYTAVSTPPDAAGGDILRDRHLGRTGYACADCHRLGDEPAEVLRPAPPLGGLAARRGFWVGATDSPVVAANLCVERWLARPALDGPRLGALAAALAALPSPASAPPDSGGAPGGVTIDLPEGDDARGAALYDHACRHCHEGGPAGALWGRPFARGSLIRIARGADRPAHPGTLMPPFTPAVLSDVNLADLSSALADAASADM